LTKQAAFPLLEALQNHINTPNCPFHTPGHKQGRGLWGPWREFLRGYVDQIDLTELPGLDDLHNPGGAIKKAQELAADCFGADASYFLVNGATAGVHAMLLAFSKPGDAVLIPRNCHQAVFGGMVLSGARPVYFRPKVHPDLLIPLAADISEVEDKLSEADVSSLFWIHPTYHGITSDLKRVIDFVAAAKENQAAGGQEPEAEDRAPGWRAAAYDRKIPVMVDEAHGPHFGFHCALPGSAMELGADITVQGAHKILGAFTQSALLHWRQGKTDRWRLEAALRLIQSTSPSYILMASLDAARGQMAEQGTGLLARTLEVAEWARAEINAIPGLHCPGKELTLQPEINGFDPTKLIVSGLDLGLTGYELGKMLARRGVLVEMAEWGAVLCLLTIADDDTTVLPLIEALRAVSNTADRRPRPELPALPGMDIIPAMVMTPREAYFASSMPVRMEAAHGHVAAEMIAPYPPGIPVLYPGERIHQDVISLIHGLRENGATFHGPADPNLDTIRVVGG